MEKVSYETGRILSIGVCNRYANSVNHIKKLIADGVYSEILGEMGTNVKDHTLISTLFGSGDVIGKHYLGDVMVGMIVGALAGIAFGILAKFVTKKYIK